MQGKMGVIHMTRASGNMRLEVFTNDVHPSDTQRITVMYNPDKEYTCVGCNADVVTISLAINVLQDLFNKAAANMTVTDIDEIQTITKRAVGLE